MGWLNFLRELNDLIVGLRVSENEVEKYEYCKGKLVFGSMEMESYGSTIGLKYVPMVKLVSV